MILARAMAVAIFMFWALVITERCSRMEARLVVLEARPEIDGYLYKLNEAGTWDRVRSSEELPPGSMLCIIPDGLHARKKAKAEQK